jgi:hypothetical protein
MPDLAPQGARPLEDLLAGLAAALAALGPPWAGAPLAPMRDKGLAHDHVRLLGTGAIARVPKQSQMDLAAAENLAYQAACFRRSGPSGHVPRLHAVMPPAAGLPHGGLVVEEILGRSLRLPDDLPALAAALARIHALPVPDARAPLRDAADPLADLLAEIAAQAEHLAAAGLPARPRGLIQAELDRLRALCARPARPERRLISFDAHPGNFILRPDGTAVLVDLEKARYAYPGLDLAHATLYTSTTWDLDAAAVLTNEQTAAAYAAWAGALGPEAAAMAPWHVPLRRAMWLWSVTWCAKWRVLSGAARKRSADGEDWSAAASDPALIAHVRGRVDHYLDAPVIAGIIAGFDALERLLA